MISHKEVSKTWEDSQILLLDEQVKLNWEIHKTFGDAWNN
jgi:hypothetical protein